jgi:hypothetical protein
MKFLVLALCIAAAVAAPVSLDEANLVRAAWNEVKHHEIDILYAVFKAHPAIQARFPAFVGQDLDSLKGTAPFALHSTRIVSFMSGIIELLGVESHIPAIKDRLKEFAVNHKAREIPREQYTDFRNALTDYVKSHAAWNEATAAAWEHATGNMFAIVFNYLDTL